MSEAFSYLLRVRYGECDAQQVVFNSRYADYIDVAVTEFTRSLWGDYNQMLEKGIDSQVVSLNLDWLGSARFDDVLALHIAPQKLGNTSYTLGVRFENYASGQALAEATITYVVLDAKTMTKIPIPDAMRAELERGARGVTVDHAGASVNHS